MTKKVYTIEIEQNIQGEAEDNWQTLLQEEQDKLLPAAAHVSREHVKDDSHEKNTSFFNYDLGLSSLFSNYANTTESPTGSTFFPVEELAEEEDSAPRCFEIISAYIPTIGTITFIGAACYTITEVAFGNEMVIDPKLKKTEIIEDNHDEPQRQFDDVSPEKESTESRDTGIGCLNMINGVGCCFKAYHRADYASSGSFHTRLYNNDGNGVRLSDQKQKLIKEGCEEKINYMNKQIATPQDFEKINKSQFKASIEYLEKHCCMDLQDLNGFTVLMQAAFYGREDYVDVILEHKCADVTIQNEKDGKTALNYAKEKNFEKIVNSLTEHATKQISDSPAYNKK